MCPPGLVNEEMLGKLTRQSWGFSNTVIALLLQICLGVGHSDLLFLPTAVGSF